MEKEGATIMMDALFLRSGGPTSSFPPATSSPTPRPTFFPGFPPEDAHMSVDTILIVIIFCIVCFLLLVAFFYTFCFRCSLDALLKDRPPTPNCSLDRGDTTFRRSSSCPSMGNSI